MKIRTFINPFEKFSEVKLLVTGCLVTLVFSFIAFILSARFDGIIDMHFVDSISWYQPLLDNTINIVTLSIIFFIFGYLINKKTRLIDIITSALISRLPIIIVLPLFNINGYISRINERIINSIDFKDLQNKPQINTSDLFITMIFAGISFAILILYIIILWNGIKTATNLKPNFKNISAFILLFIFAEIISKFLIIN